MAPDGGPNAGGGAPLGGGGTTCPITVVGGFGGVATCRWPTEAGSLARAGRRGRSLVGHRRPRRRPLGHLRKPHGRRRSGPWGAGRRGGARRRGRGRRSRLRRSCGRSALRRRLLRRSRRPIFSVDRHGLETRGRREVRKGGHVVRRRVRSISGSRRRSLGRRGGRLGLRGRGARRCPLGRERRGGGSGSSGFGEFRLRVVCRLLARWSGRCRCGRRGVLVRRTEP